MVAQRVGKVGGISGGKPTGGVPRAEVTAGDVEAALAESTRISALRVAGITDAMIAKVLHLKVGAVERVGPAPAASPASPPPSAPTGVLASASPNVPPGAAASPSKPAAVSESPSALAELLGGATERGTYTETMKLMRETASTDLLSSFLQEQLEEKRLSNRQHRLEIERLERGGATPGRGDGDGGTVAILLPNGQLIHAAARDADAVRASFGRAEREDRVAVLERELQIERDKGRESRMESLLRDMERRHAEELRGLEGRLARHKTQDDIELDGLARSTSLKYDTQSRLLSEGAERVKDAPHLGAKLERIADQVIGSAEFQRRVRAIVAEPGDMEGEVVEPSLEHLKEVAAELEGIASAGQSDTAGRRPGRLIPGEWISQAPADSHDPEASHRVDDE
jgi:hypothetical protein